MSHSSSRIRASDANLPLAHRASHARSCVNHVANRLGLTREQLLQQVLEQTAIDLCDPRNEEELVTALAYVEGL